MLESELRQWARENGGPSWHQTTPEVLEALGADPVFEGPQATNLEFWQFSMRQGVEKIDGKWYTKYVAGPVFDKPEDQAAWVAQKTQERAAAIRNSIVNATQKRLDDFAATRNYSSLDSISKYKDISDAEIDTLPGADRPLVKKFRTECRYLALATAQTWAVLYRGLAEVEAGNRPMPGSFDEIEGELPPLVWPEV